MNMTSSQLLSEIKGITHANIEVTRKKFFHLSDEQKKWRPNMESWNLLEIFAHLNEYTRFYNSTFLKKIQSTKFRTPTENFVSSPLGRSAWSSMKLGNAKNVKRKFRALRAFNPTINPGLMQEQDIQRFCDLQHDFLAIIDSAASINIRKAKVHTSMSKIIKLRLGDALLFASYHNERHLQQALNILNNKQFPKK
ncbi:MAG: hypothetical protein E6Q37_05095 [Crocinitomicaceae bacterium]|nr:MAG: hypothetical protein E6Q37_05095 [Crocinitomicaceae bacterium]